MYLALAWSLPPWMRVPNCPEGTRRFTLLEPTKSCAIEMMVPAKEASPWW